MSEEARGIIVSARKVYRVGDGETRFTEPGEGPMSAAEKYQPSLEEMVHDLGIQMNNLAVDLAVAFTPLVQGLAEIVQSPEWVSFMEALAHNQPDTDAGRSAAAFLRHLRKGNPADPKAEARRCSREDLAQKRKALRQHR